MDTEKLYYSGNYLTEQKLKQIISPTSVEDILRDNKKNMKKIVEKYTDKYIMCRIISELNRINFRTFPSERALSFECGSIFTIVVR